MTNIATEALQIEDVHDGKGKKTEIRHQVNLALAFGQKSVLPILSRVFPWNIPNVGTVPELFFRFKYLVDVLVSATVLDRGYFSLEKLERFLRGGHHCLMKRFVVGCRRH